MLLAAAFLLCGCGGAKAEYTAEAGTAEPVVKEVTMAVVGDIMVHDYQYEEPMTRQRGLMTSCIIFRM